jgi:hypothetical protein
MPLNIQPPIEQEFTLEQSDKEFGNTGEPTKVKIKQAREGENIERMQLWKRYERVFQRNGNTMVAQEVSPAEVKRKEVFLTLTACNLMMGEGSSAKPLFKFPLKENEFNEAWAMLPPVVADEIYDKVLEVNLDWSAMGEGS